MCYYYLLQQDIQVSRTLRLPDLHSSYSNSLQYPCGHGRDIPVATIFQRRVQLQRARDNSLVKWSY
jgi:hypothetical protein